MLRLPPWAALMITLLGAAAGEARAGSSDVPRKMPVGPPSPGASSPSPAPSPTPPPPPPAAPAPAPAPALVAPAPAPPTVIPQDDRGFLTPEPGRAPVMPG